jgi:hypothetical protein
MAMERVEAYRNVREMTPEVLLELAQSHKLYSMKSTFRHDIGLHNDIRVSEEEIEAMGETLKAVVFFVSPAIMRGAMELARDKGVLIKSPRWLNHGNG